MRTDVERLLNLAASERLYWLKENVGRGNHGPQRIPVYGGLFA